ncbi:4Fe-4S dicluster domain-containing protein [bacterium]|nr:4Fe-4S dicluster domain-containing protein [bacterium]
MELNNLKKWQDKLHVCIRCGYCFEHCHIFKITGWESDSPRGKLIMLHGLLQGDIKPSDYLAEKMFECYMCKRCEASCSAKVEVTEVFMDARVDFAEAGYDVVGTTSGTNEDLCCRCQVCVAVCKHEARSLDKENKKIVIDKVKCQSCGCCVAACPSGAAYSQEGFRLTPNELREQVVNYLAGGVE